MKQRLKKSFIESDISVFINKSDLNKKIKTLATKAEFKTEQGKMVKLQAFNSSYFRGKGHFEDGGTQNYLVFQLIYRFFKIDWYTDQVSTWKSKGLSDENIKPSSASDNSLAPLLNHTGFRTRMKFDGKSLKQDNITFNHKPVVNVCIVFEINLRLFKQIADFPLGKSLIGAVKLTKNNK